MCPELMAAICSMLTMLLGAQPEHSVRWIGCFLGGGLWGTVGTRTSGYLKLICDLKPPNGRVRWVMSPFDAI